ncbi:hypothetical protein VSR69_45390 [Paraburkholderia phytofirmans]
MSNDLANGSALQRENTDKDEFTSENAIVVCKEAFVDRDAFGEDVNVYGHGIVGR